MVSSKYLEAFELLKNGFPPKDEAILDDISIGSNMLYDFLHRYYIQDYITAGGCKIKFLIGKEGSGKTHLLYRLKVAALKEGYATCYINATDIRLQYFNDIYGAIVSKLSIDDMVKRLCKIIAQELGHNIEQMPVGKTFVDWIMEEGRSVKEFVRRDIATAIEKLYRNTDIDRDFAKAFIQLCGDNMGISNLDHGQRNTIYRWLRGQPVNSKELKRVFLYKKLDKYNARYMLRSLIVMLRLAGYRGLFVAIDNLDDIVAKDPVTGRSKYTKSRRDDTYESIRQLIDEFENLPYLFVCFAARPQILQNEKEGFRSYDALWSRIQDEILISDFNKFNDLINLDSAWERERLSDLLIQLHANLKSAYTSWGLKESSSLYPQNIFEPGSGMVSPIRRVVLQTSQNFTMSEVKDR